MSKRGLVRAMEAAEWCLDGTEATARYTGNARTDLVCLTSHLSQNLSGGDAQIPALVDLIRAAYHLGREQAIQRVAIGLDMVAMETPESASAEGLGKDGRLIRPDRGEPSPLASPPQSFPRGTPPPDTVANPARGERPDGYDNVPIEEEGICLGDEPKPPQPVRPGSRAQKLNDVPPEKWTQ